MKHPAIVMDAVAGSSQIKAMGHDLATNTLAVQFRAGDAVYHYAGVSAETFKELKAAKSVGKHLHSKIKPHYKHTPIPKEAHEQK